MNQQNILKKENTEVEKNYKNSKKTITNDEEIDKDIIKKIFLIMYSSIKIDIISFETIIINSIKKIIDDPSDIFSLLLLLELFPYNGEKEREEEVLKYISDFTEGKEISKKNLRYISIILFFFITALENNKIKISLGMKNLVLDWLIKILK